MQKVHFVKLDNNKWDMQVINEPNKRFICQTELCSGKAADTLITIKESIANGHRIYSIELYEINKASDRFRGLCDAADNSGQGN